MSSPPNRMFFLSSRQPAWAGAPGMHEACPRPREEGGAGGPQPWPAQIRLGRAGPLQLQPCPGPTHTPPAWHSRAMACPNLILWHPLIYPNFWTPKCSPFPPHLPQAALSFPANRAEGKVMLNQGVWSLHPNQSNTNVKKLDKELSNLKLAD